MLKKAVIMAGGEGVRLRPLTYAVPKPLLPIGDISVIEFIIRGLVQQGIEDIYVIANFQFEKFREYSDQWKKYTPNISVIKEEEKKGTVGGIFFIKDRLTEDFLITNADIINKTDVQEMAKEHKAKGAVFTLGVKEYDVRVPYGVAESTSDNRLLKITEKPSTKCTISAGINMLSPYVLKHINGEKIDMPYLIEKLLSEKASVATHLVKGLWFDIGRVEDYENAVELIEEMEQDGK